ncbi:CRISPR-associated endonuclease Cas2 [Heliophilum fasciatum]|uniref:CRISPR-associated endonuclease Cas2 n=1 Tax=Heliophilum fasciatum TaxID=35700 RepID=UPI00311AA350
MLVTYDVSTDTPEGRKRLRKVAQACKDFGQRVQKSVFECTVSEVQYERFVHRLLAHIDKKEDSLRIYRLREPKETSVRVYGIDLYVNFEEPLVF